MNKLTGKTAIITGASSGIGATIATHLASEGANVVLVARRADKLEALANEINSKNEGRAIAVQTNVSKQSEIDEMIVQAEKAFGHIDIYINNAGVMLEATVQSGKVELWEQMIDVNIKGALYGINSVLPQMIEKKSGHVINVSSVSGQEVTKTSTVYSATKFALRAISMGMEKELARTGVRVTNISPGMVDTDLAAWRSSDAKKSRTDKLERKPLHTDDIARAVVYAVTQPSYVNVNEITVRPV